MDLQILDVETERTRCDVCGVKEKVARVRTNPSVSNFLMIRLCLHCLATMTLVHARAR